MRSQLAWSCPKPAIRRELFFCNFLFFAILGRPSVKSFTLALLENVLGFLVTHAGDTEHVCRHVGHRLAIQEVITAIYLNPGITSALFANAGFRNNLLAVIVRSIARQMPRTWLVLRPTKTLDNPAFSKICIKPNQIQTKL